jgi:hypothetical protein
MRIVVGLFLAGGVAVVVWAWRTRTPRDDRGKFVSSAWLDDHIRGRRE